MFQLVRASDDEIAVWQTDYGHIYVYKVCAGSEGLKQVVMREAPGAGEPAATFADEALRFATEEAWTRQLIGQGV